MKRKFKLLLWVNLYLNFDTVIKYSVLVRDDKTCYKRKCFIFFHCGIRNWSEAICMGPKRLKNKASFFLVEFYINVCTVFCTAMVEYKRNRALIFLTEVKKLCVFTQGCVQMPLFLPCNTGWDVQSTWRRRWFVQVIWEHCATARNRVMFTKIRAMLELTRDQLPSHSLPPRRRC